MGRLSVSSARRPGRQGRTAAAGRAGPAAGRAADCGRRDGRPPRRGRERDRSCQGKKRAGGCRNARWRMRKIQAGRRSALGGATMKTQEARSGDPAIRRSGDPAIRRSGDPAIRRSGDPAIRRSGDPAIRRSGDPAIRRSGDPAIRRLWVDSGLVKPCAKLFSVRPAIPPCLLPNARFPSRPSFTMTIASPPKTVARPAGPRCPHLCRALPVPFGVHYAESGGNSIRACLLPSDDGKPVSAATGPPARYTRLTTHTTLPRMCASWTRHEYGA